MLGVCFTHKPKNWWLSSEWLLERNRNRPRWGIKSHKTSQPHSEARNFNQSCSFTNIHSFQKCLTIKATHISEFVFHRTGQSLESLCVKAPATHAWQLSSVTPQNLHKKTWMQGCTSVILGLLCLDGRQRQENCLEALGPVSLEHRTKWDRYKREPSIINKVGKLSSDFLTCPVACPCPNTCIHAE